MEDAQWFAAGGGIARCGPFKTQREAWEAMRLTDAAAKKAGGPYPRDIRVWPEWSVGHAAK